MSKTEKIAFEKSLIGQEVSWTDSDGENIGIVIELGEDEGLYVQKCMELEGMEVTNDICFIPVEDVKLRTFVVAEKIEGDFSDGAIVSWETSNGTYYGDIQASSTEGPVRGEPQGLEIDGTPERPAYVVRVWQESDTEWEPTNVTIVAYADHLKVEQQMPQSQEDDSQEANPENVPTEEVMPSRAPKSGGKKSMDPQAIAELVAQEVAKALSAIKEEEKAVMPAPAEAPAEETTLVSALEDLMSNSVMLYFSAHRAHWNVTGQDFSEYHGLFEEIYSDVYEAIDPLAENIRKMGEFPETLNEIVAEAVIADDSMTTDAKALAADLLVKNAALLAMFKAAFEVANASNEQGIANFIAERIDMHEKWDWQLKASIGVGASVPAEADQAMKSAEVVEEVKSDDAPAAEEATATEEVVAKVATEEVAIEEVAAEEVVEEKAAGANGRVVPTHKTDVDMTGTWDGPVNKRHVKSPGDTAYFDKIFAYQKPNTAGDMKAHYSFIHHIVSADGTPGAASFGALSTAMAVLNGGRAGTVLRGAARQGVYRHLAAHYKDAGREAPELKSDEFVNDMMIKNGFLTEPIFAEDGEVVVESTIEVVEEKSAISFDELKEFHALIKVL
jgi:DNA-binding ferritin-like protein